MQRLNDKYGRGSAAVNGAGFVDLEPGDTFSGLEAKLRLLQTVIYENRMLGLRASIASRRNANELSKHMAPGEKEEAHKFAAKNVGALFARGVVGIRHFDKKAIRDDAPKPVVLRIFSVFVFAKERMIATITLRQEKDGNKLYAIEALEINKDTDSERTPRGGTAPLQNQVSQLASRIAYYVGDVNRTKPLFLARSEPFSIECATKLIRNEIMNQTAATRMKISIITVCYNAEKSIADAMESVAKQQAGLLDCSDRSDCSIGRRLEIEYIVVDGGSTDGTVEIIREFASRCAAIDHSNNPNNRTIAFRWVSEKDCGMYDALNKGMRMATGDVIGILNADDALDGEDVIARVCEMWVSGESEVRGEKVDCLYGNVRFVRGEMVRGEGVERLRALPTLRVCFARFWKPWMLQWGYMPPHPAIFIRRECFEKWGGYEPDRKEYRIAADYELLIRFFRVHRMKARYMPICTTVMRTGGVSTKDVEARKKLNEEIVKANRVNGYFCCFPMLLPKYAIKIWEVILPRLGLI